MLVNRTARRLSAAANVEDLRLIARRPTSPELINADLRTVTSTVRSPPPALRLGDGRWQVNLGVADHAANLGTYSAQLPVVSGGQSDSDRETEQPDPSVPGVKRVLAEAPGFEPGMGDKPKPH